MKEMIGREHWMSTLTWIDRKGASIKDYLARLEDQLEFDLASALECWQRDGVVLFKGVVDRGLLDALESDIQYLRRHHLEFDLQVEVNGTQKHISSLTDAELESPGLKFNNIHAISTAAARLSLVRPVAVFLRHVFCAPPCALQSLTFYKGSQQPVHVDYPYVRCQTRLAHLAASWIPLEDIHPDSGPLAYYPGSHCADVSGFFDWGGGSIVMEPDSPRTPIELSNYLRERMKAAGIEPRVYCPNRGDVLVWHGNLSHEGTPIRDERRTRKSYVTHYTSLDAYPPAHLKSGAPESGWIARENGGYVFEYPWLTNPKQLPSARNGDISR